MPGGSYMCVDAYVYVCVCVLPCMCERGVGESSGSQAGLELNMFIEGVVTYVSPVQVLRLESGKAHENDLR